VPRRPCGRLARRSAASTASTDLRTTRSSRSSGFRVHDRPFIDCPKGDEVIPTLLRVSDGKVTLTVRITDPTVRPDPKADQSIAACWGKLGL
jgi:hypothetical protein